VKRILFVDDDESVLDALRNILRKRRNEWDMVFSIGAKAALTELAKAPFDVVVTDMRMPGMDGAALLTHVRDHYPGTARIVLSGHAERDAIVRALPVTHQFLNKPCDAVTLRSVVERTSTDCPASTVSPAATSTFTIVPCIGALIVPLPAAPPEPLAPGRGRADRFLGAALAAAASGSQSFTE